MMHLKPASSPTLYIVLSSSRNLERLPIEIIQEIASYLSLLADITNFSLANHRLFDILSSPQIYKQLVARDWDVGLWEQEMEIYSTSAEYRHQSRRELEGLYLKRWKQICDLHSKVRCLLLTAQTLSFRYDWTTLATDGVDMPSGLSIQLKDVLWGYSISPGESLDLGPYQYIRTWIEEIGLFLPYILLHHGTSLEPPNDGRHVKIGATKENQNIFEITKGWNVSQYIVDASRELQYWAEDQQSYLPPGPSLRTIAQRTLNGNICYSATVLTTYSLCFPPAAIDPLDWVYHAVDLWVYSRGFLSHEVDDPPFMNLQRPPRSPGLSRALCFPAQALMAGRIYEFIRLFHASPGANHLSSSEDVFPPVQPFTGRRDILLLDRPEDSTSASSLAISPWTDHYLPSIIIALETDQEFVGYYSYDDETQICDGPMRITLSCERVGTEEQCISHWELNGKGLDAVGRFNLSIHIYSNGNVRGVKNYDVWRWRWIGAVTSLGLFGTWGHEGPVGEEFQTMAPGGLWWIWPKTWSINRSYPDM